MEKRTTFFAKFFSSQLSSVTCFYDKIKFLIHDICDNDY